MADATSTVDWGSALDGAAQSAGKPLANTPAAFASFYAPIADQVSQKTGIDSNTLLGQWGLETGWGKSVIPGTNNLGNMKMPKGQSGGVSATDNQTGSNDQYQKFANPSDFADAYTNLIKSKYSGAVGTGVDAHATATALKNGGYAQDPDYVAKLTNATSAVAQARGQAPSQGTKSSGNWGALLDSVIPSANAAQGGSSTTSSSFDDFQKQFPGPADGSGDDTNPLVAFGAGLGRGVQKTVLGAQSLVGKGASAIGADNVGNWLQQNAQQGDTTGQQEFQNNGGNSFSGKAGEIIGETAPMLAVPAEIGPMAIASGVQNAGNASLANQPIAPAFVEGAGMGAAGAAAGNALAAGVNAAKPAFTKLGNALKGGEAQATSNIANEIGSGNLDDVISNLRQNSNEIIPGSLPTAGETANNAAVVRLQRAAQNTPAGQEAFPARAAANNDARLQAGQDAVGPSANNSNMMGPGLEDQAQAFTRTQAQRVQQGLTELPPTSQAQADLMQTPAYQTAIRAARNDAQNAGESAFADQSAALNRNLADQVEGIAGTPESLEAARTARRAQGNQDYAGVAGPVNAGTQAFADLEARPGFRQALREASGIEDNIHGSNAPDPITVQPGQRSLQVQPDGTLGWVEGPAQRFADASVLQGARSRLSDMANAAAIAGKGSAANGYRETLNALDNFLGSADNVGSDIADSFNRARSNYAANSVPIDQQAFLQQKLAPAVNNLTGEVNPGTLNSTINAIQRDQLKPGLRPADRITDDQVSALQNLGQQAAAAPGNVAGLSSQGQEFLRQALENGASKSDAAATARDAFNQHLAAQSPAYAEMLAAQSGQGADIASRQALSDALEKLSQSANNASGAPQLTLNGAKGLARNAALSGVQQGYAQNLLADLQRASTANAPLGAAGSQTSANEALKGGSGLLGWLSRGTSSDLPTLGAIAGEGLHGIGAIPAAFAGGLVKKALSDAAGKTEKASIDLLLNPKKLADALEKYKNQPQAKQIFIDTLKKNAAGSKAGALAVQSFNAGLQ